MRRFSLAFAATLALSVAAGCSADDAAAENVEDYSSDPNALLDVPFYFAMPKSALSGPLERNKYSYPTLWNAARERGLTDVGLRVIAVPEQGDPGTPARREARRQMAHELARAGALTDGDIVLSFRPALADSMAYPHIQMGSTHAGLTFTRGEGDAAQAFNVDQPLDGDYNVVEGGTRFVGKFDSAHYAGCVPSDDAPAGSIKCKKNSAGAFVKEAGVEALHILRPRNMTEARKANLRSWLDRLGETHARIRAEGGLNFNSDYLKPLLANPAYRGSVSLTTTKLGKILLGLESPPQDFDMFCSELAFYVLTLSSCTEDEIRDAGESAACAAEENAPFKPMKLVDPEYAGLADGPLLNLLAGRPEPSEANALVESIFAEGSAPLSSGHRAVAAAVAPLMAGVKQYYQARLGAPEMVGAAVAQLNRHAGDARNYSPTAFLVNAALPADHPLRSVDYVATVVFTPEQGMAKARRLARNPVP